MKTFLYLLIIFVLFSCTRDDDSTDDPTSMIGNPEFIVQTDDLNVITCVDIGELYEFKVLKTNATGAIIWEKKYTSTEIHFLRKLLPLSNSNFLVAMDQMKDNYTDSANRFVRLICMDGNGIIKWENEVDFPEDIVCKDICSTSDNGFIICGDYTSDTMFYYSKLDNTGNVIWTQTYSDPWDYENVKWVMADTDSITILGAEGLLLRTDNNGVIARESAIGYSLADQYYFGESSMDFLVVSNSKSGIIEMKKVNFESQITWNKSYSIPDCDYVLLLDLKVRNGENAILYKKYFNGIGEPSKSRYYILKTSFSGDEIWHKTIQNEDDHVLCFGILENGDIIAGVLNSSELTNYGWPFYLEVIKN